MPRAAEPPDVREAILDAAMRLLERSGYRKMTMEEIAQEARIGKSTIYGYFSNKEDVAVSEIERHWKRVVLLWQDLASTDLPPQEQLAQMLLALVMCGFDKAQRYKSSLDETMASIRSRILQRRETFYEALIPHLCGVLERGCREKIFECAETKSTARTLLVCLSGLNPSNLSPRELGEREEIETRARQIIDLLMNGLAYRSEDKNG